MIFILFTIAFITIIGILFKVFPKYDIDSFQAIVVNYAVCVIMATLHSYRFPITTDNLTEPWFPFAIGMSLLFIFGFYFQSIIFKVFGIAISSIVLKLSLIITALFAILLYNEAMPISKSVGLLIALAAIVLVCYPQKSSSRSGQSTDVGNIRQNDSSHSKGFGILNWIILGLSFFISAGVDIGFTYVERSVSSQQADPQFIGCATGFAFLWGTLREGTRLMLGSSTLETKNIVAGIILGIANYATFWGMMKAIASRIDTSIVFTTINIGVILCSLVVAIFLFNERLSRTNLAGVILSLISVWLISNNI